MITLLYILAAILGIVALIVAGIALYLSPAAPNPPVALGFYVEGKKVDQMILKDDQPQAFQLGELDKFNNPTQDPLDAAPQWALSDPSFGDLAVADDGMSATFTSNGKLGDCELQATAVLKGAPLLGTLPLTIVPGSAASIVISPV